ncbi:hypothetical protein AGABI1DRAFT_108919 [Agaricus bisporus var. burnettii JB137-S8]|uniref:Palmitoyltransferase n=1 Tax=Agaricus bisporus var. burnettii (strain JB137-S8 / ATCC MYA-4627 / FGSC 10392) TaxID=597362 RepID=K5VNY5_AGABU|nr:uncharacterized protein AGABI1DRAFT_108919 [Agaricus bisporus var. burnettii JB137-S8]EKM76159.1 hypothetical protein AGABI1DRAFT_108919 [Agaricus bisporus var. burnettii JB137-S8]
MDDPTAIVSQKAEPASSSVVTESAVATNITFSQPKEANGDPETNIFLAAQRGDVNLLRELIESGRAKATDRDEQNITPLHWAAINAHLAACRLGAWKRALEEGGMNEYGIKRSKPFSEIVTRVLLNKPSYTESVSQSPYFAGIIFSSIIWVTFCWITRLVNPPKPSSDEELRSIIEDLASEGRLNGQTFCIQCMAKKPLRSKHCRVCDRCIARSDHHCPWVWNCVGANNHRQFVLFVLSLVCGIILFDYLTFGYFSSIQTSQDPSQISPSCILPSDLCYLVSQDSFLVSVALWSTLQLTWTIVLLASQLWQVARQMTTLEVSNLGRYGYMGGRGGASYAGQMGHRHRHGGSPIAGLDTEDTALVGDASSTSSGHQTHQHRSCAGCGSGFLMNLLGFDRFTKGKAVDGLARAGKASNPFDLGFFGNCKDFWTKGRELGVEYETLYDVPLEGFREAKRRRTERDDDGDSSSIGGDGRKKSGRKGLFMGLGIGGSARRGGYEPVNQV